MKCPVGRLASWALQIQQYNFRIEYIAGKSNAVAAKLFRPTGYSSNSTDLQLLFFQVDFPHKNPSEARKNQLSDNYLK